MIIFALLAALCYSAHGAANKYLFATRLGESRRIGQISAALLVTTLGGFIALPLVFFCDTHWVPEAGPYVFLALAIAPPAFIMATYSYSREDASVVGPLIGTKILFLPFIELLVFGRSLAPAIWIGAGLSALGIALVSQTDIWTLRPKKLLRTGVVMMLGAAAVFALGDLLIGRAVLLWPTTFDFTVHLNVLFGGLTFLYLAGLAAVRGRSGMSRGVFRLDRAVLREACGPLVVSALAILLTQFLLFESFALGENVTLSNIIYNTRVMFIVGLMPLLVLGGRRRVEKAGARAYLYRASGSVLILSAIVLALT